MSRVPILYDADCGFCRWALSKALLWDRAERLRPVALQDPEADTLLGPMPEERRMASWHLVLNPGSVHSGGYAFAPLLRLLPGGRPLSVLAGALPGPSDRAYRLVAEHRMQISPFVPDRSKARARALVAARS